MTRYKKALPNNVKNTSQEYSNNIYPVIFNKQWQRYEGADKSKKEIFASLHPIEKITNLTISDSKKNNLLLPVQYPHKK